MPFDILRDALRRAVLTGAFQATFARHARDFDSLASCPDAGELVARLDRLPPFEAERDAILADLLRLWRRVPGGGALTALVYALHGGVLRRFLRFTDASDDPRDQMAAVLYALVERLEVFDPDARAKKVQDRIEDKVRRRLVRALKADRRRQRVHATVVDLAAHAQSQLATGELALSELIERRGRRPKREPDPVDDDAVDSLQAQLVARDLLRPREAELVCRVEVQGQPIADVARDLDMSVAAARKALQRARASLRARRDAMASLFLSPSETSGGLV